ncbi:class I SAM-dependent methyltransferase [Dongia deserti]|uniref:class I SAM-dependent methyltransferase n=1 Tax=Dongia deserti TaxID=2268030 RepID=UPI000E64B8AA|nr:methyltransferase domain-containing protein [Dongia deserti]
MPDEQTEPVYAHDGYCPVCQKPVRFAAAGSWYRQHLLCPLCQSVVRERALALILFEERPNWRTLTIHESSPLNRGISAKLKAEGGNYIPSHYFPDQPLGIEFRGFRNENLERQTFPDDSLDIVISLDVMEHVFHPDLVYSEIYRTLKPGGVYLHTFPIAKTMVPAFRQRARLEEDGTVCHLVEPPQYHGNPVDAQGSLVTYDYGYEVDRQIAAWAPFDVRVTRFWDQTHGIIGDYTEVVICTKP